MTLKKIVAVAEGSAGDAETLSVAARLAGDHDAVVRVVPAYPDAAADFIAIAMDRMPIPQSTFDALRESERELQASIHESVRSAAVAAGVPFGPGEGGPRLVIAPRDVRPWLAVATELVLADLMLVSRQSIGAAGSPMSDIFSDALLRARTPVLIASGDPAKLTGCAAVAWDGGAQAGKAVQAALPLLARAERVIMLQCPSGLAGGHEAGSDFDRLARYLTLHGVMSIDRTVVDDGREGPALLAEAKRQDAGLLVAGAYGHSKLQQIVFGGATRAFLEGDAGPHLLLAH